LLEPRLARERSVHGALGGDHLEALDLLWGQPARQAQRELEECRHAFLGLVVAALYFDFAEVPLLAARVHLNRDCGASREARREEVLRGGASVLAALLLRFVGDEPVLLELDIVGESLRVGAVCDRLHWLPLIRLAD